jgi:hypothetical protein
MGRVTEKLRGIHITTHEKITLIETRRLSHT